MKDWFDKDDLEIEQENPDVILNYFNDLMIATIENDPVSFTLNHEYKNEDSIQKVNETTEYMTTFDANTLAYIVDVESGTQKFKEAYVEDPLKDYYSYKWLDVYGNPYSHQNVFDGSYVKNEVKNDLKEIFYDFKSYASYNSSQISSLLEKEELDTRIELEEDGKIVSSVEIKFEYKTLENNMYSISYNKSSNAYNPLGTYEYITKFSYTFDKTKLYSVYSSTYISEKCEEAVYVDKVSVKNFGYEFDKALYDSFNFSSGGYVKKSSRVNVFVDGENVYDSYNCYGESVDEILSSIDEFSNSNIDSDNIFYYSSDWNSSKEPFSKYVSGSKVSSIENSFIYAMTDPNEGKAKVMVNYFFRHPTFYNKSQYDISLFSKDSTIVEEVDLGEYQINTKFDYYTFDEMITLNGEKINSKTINLTQEGVYVVNCYLTSSQVNNTQVNYYFNDELILNSKHYENRDVSSLFSSYDIGRYNVVGYKDKELQTPFVGNERIYEGMNIYLDFEVPDGEYYVLVVDKRQSFGEYKYATFFKYKISDFMHSESYTYDCFWERIENTEELSIVVNGDNILSQSNLHLTEYEHEVFLNFTEVENRKIYFIVIDYKM